MAGNRANAVTGEIATGTSAKTLLQLVAAANVKVKVSEIGIYFKGTSNSAAPIKVDVLRQTDAGTASALTPKKLDDAQETLQTEAQHTATAEPSAGDVLMSMEVHPQSGFHWQAPFGQDIIIPGGGRLGVRVTAGADVNAIAQAIFEE
jgi:hypothetical protein